MINVTKTRIVIFAVMNFEPIISIVVPTYNRGHLIDKTILSLLSQTDHRYEIIIVDDGSTDDTEEIIKSYLSDKVSYYKKENGERAVARNFGTQKARGKYINWFDSDDIALDNHVATAIDMVERYHTPEVFALGYSIENTSGKLIQDFVYSKEIMNSEIHKGNFFACNPVFVRRDIALENPFNEDRGLSASEDYELWMRLASKFPFYAINTKSLKMMHHDERSVLMSNADKLILRFEKFIEYTTSNLKISAFLGENIGYFIMKNYLILAVDLAANGHKKEAKYYVKKAFKASKLILLERTFFATIKHILF
jgi:glycosyltransferase involved in cell wall biosynthesis